MSIFNWFKKKGHKISEEEYRQATHDIEKLQHEINEIEDLIKHTDVQMGHLLREARVNKRKELMLLKEKYNL